MKKTKFFGFILTVCVFLSVFALFSFAGDVETKGFIFNEISENTLELVDYKGDDNALVIPNKVSGKTVTRIAQNALAGLKSVKTITIPGTVKNIERGAIKNCPKLVSVNIKKGNLKKFDDAVINCSSLEKIVLPENITKFTPVMGCPSLETVKFSEENEVYETFDGVVYSKNHKSIIYFPSGKRDIYYIIPDCVKNVGEYCFGSARYLEGIFIPTSVISIEANSFSNTAVLICYGGSEKPDCLKNIPWTVIVNSEPLGIPYGVSENHNKKAVTLKWNSVLGATGYRVYIFDEESGKYKTYKNVATTSCKITDLESGKEYKFAIKPYARTIDGFLFAGAYTEFSARTTLEEPRLNLNSENGRVNLKWKDIDRAYGYVVYYSEERNDGYKKIDAVRKNTFSYNELQVGKTYFFKVRAYQRVDGKNVYGALSDAEAITVLK